MDVKPGDDKTMRDASSARPGQDIQHDADPAETAEWREALESLVQAEGSERAGYVLDNLLGHAASLGLRANSQTRTAYLNTIPADQEPPFPGNLAVEERIARINRWNALAMVVRANQAHGELGGHIASYASATWSTCSRTRRPACMPAPIWKAFWAKRTWRISARRSRLARAACADCRRIRTRG
jgi:pyruvate dehydrogenase E1 component